MIDLWFPLAVYHTAINFQKHCPYLIKKCRSLIDQYSTISKTDWRCDTQSTISFYDWRSDNDRIIMELIDATTIEVKKFSKEFGLNPPENKIKCDDFWFNLATKGAYQEYHQHCNSHFSCVYYVDVNDDSGNLVFKSSEAITDMCLLPINRDNHTNLSFKTCSYTPKNDTLFLFKSNTLHMVEKNHSDSDRISISMNFRIT